jgi:hypothetical protein
MCGQARNCVPQTPKQRGTEDCRKPGRFTYSSLSPHSDHSAAADPPSRYANTIIVKIAVQKLILWATR